MLWFLLKLCLACALGFVVLIAVLQMPWVTVASLAVVSVVVGLLANLGKR